MNHTLILTGLAVALFASPTQAWNNCRHKSEFNAAVDAAGVTSVEIFALAGDLRVRGRAGEDRISAEGQGCVSEEDMLTVMDITMQRDGDQVRIFAEMPDITGETNRRWKNEYAVLDLDISLPDTVAVSVHDSSGDMRVENVTGAEVIDSSGDMELVNINGDVLIPQDSSGGISMREVGAVTIQIDSSGEIEIEDADSVTIANDTSGDIYLVRIQGDVLIGNDSSGRISVRDIGGNFVVENDTSGGIRYAEVAGAVSLPDDRNAH